MNKSLTKWDKITWLTIAFAALVGFLIILHYWPDKAESVEIISDANDNWLDIDADVIAEPNKADIENARKLGENLLNFADYKQGKIDCNEYVRRGTSKNSKWEYIEGKKE